MSGQGQAQAPSGSFLCPGGFSRVGTGHVESGQIGSQAEHMLASPNGSAPGLASGFFPGGGMVSPWLASSAGGLDGPRSRDTQEAVTDPPKAAL